jgi:hypothetical protein
VNQLQKRISPVAAGLIAEQNTVEGIVGSNDAARNRFATLRARAALAGHVLDHTPTNTAARPTSPAAGAGGANSVISRQSSSGCAA